MIELTMRPFVHLPAVPAQIIFLRVNGFSVGHASIREHDRELATVCFVIPALGPQLELTIDQLNATRPAGIIAANRDNRCLAQLPGV